MLGSKLRCRSRFAWLTLGTFMVLAPGCEDEPEPAFGGGGAGTGGAGTGGAGTGGAGMGGAGMGGAGMGGAGSGNPDVPDPPAETACRANTAGGRQSAQAAIQNLVAAENWGVTSLDLCGSDPADTCKPCTDNPMLQLLDMADAPLAMLRMMGLLPPGTLRDQFRASIASSSRLPVLTVMGSMVVLGEGQPVSCATPGNCPSVGIAATSLAADCSSFSNAAPAMTMTMGGMTTVTSSAPSLPFTFSLPATTQLPDTTLMTRVEAARSTRNAKAWEIPGTGLEVQFTAPMGGTTGCGSITTWINAQTISTALGGRLDPMPFVDPAKPGFVKVILRAALEKTAVANAVGQGG